MTAASSPHPCPGPRLAEFLSRRQFFQVGGVAATGLLTDRLALRAASAPRVPAGRARSCIFVYLLGGPPQLDTWDLKPQAPAEIRGPFRPIATRTTGLQICEHLPRLAGLSDKFALVRSVSFPNDEHTSMIYYTLTGRRRENFGVEDISAPRRADFPHLGSVIARLQPPTRAVPGFVAMPEVAVRVNGFRPGKIVPFRGARAGFLGAAFDPLGTNDDPRLPDAMPGLSLPKDVSDDRFQARKALLAAVESRDPDRLPRQGFDEVRRMAVHLTGSASNGPGLWSLDQEPSAIRHRYGPHRFGQSLLLARRLTEAGVPMAAIHFNNMSRCDGWDMHGKNAGSTLDDLKDELLPMLDQGLSALLEDLDQRGRLAETLVVCMGEFGRTPKINNAGGRDHWGACQSVLLAGGGIRGGQAYGASDKNAAYPRDAKVDPVDIHATIYRCLGIDPAQEIYDQGNRPQPLCTGQVVERLIQ